MIRPLLVLSALLAFSAQANTVKTVFKTDSALPQELREKLINYVEQHCGEYVIPFGLSELETTVVQTNQAVGVTRLDYSTTLSSTYYFDGMHPTSVRIEAASLEIDAAAEFPYFDIDHVTVDGMECK